VPELYQHLLSGAAGYQEFGSRVLRQIEAANAFRQTEKVKELASILVHIPIREYQLAAQYHLVLCKCREKEYQSEALERIAEHSNSYRAKALISRAAFDLYQGNAKGALYFYTEALRVNPTVSDFIKASTGIATLKAAEGFSDSALKDIEMLIPILHHAEPLTLFQTLNSYAVELTERGRIHEAHNVLTRAASSPLAPFYPELRASFSDVRLRPKRRSTVIVARPRIEPYEPEIEIPRIAKARVQAGIDFMNENYQRKIALREIAEAVNISVDQFSHIFKIETGLSPIDYLIRLRMEKASWLLKTSFLTIKQVMAAVGYNSKGHFAKHFKRHYGLSPSEYRGRFFY